MIAVNFVSLEWGTIIILPAMQSLFFFFNPSIAIILPQVFEFVTDCDV
jgi:hypothetical protein